MKVCFVAMAMLSLCCSTMASDAFKLSIPDGIVVESSATIKRYRKQGSAEPTSVETVRSVSFRIGEAICTEVTSGTDREFAVTYVGSPDRCRVWRVEGRPKGFDIPYANGDSIELLGMNPLCFLMRHEHLINSKMKSGDLLKRETRPDGEEWHLSMPAPAGLMPAGSRCVMKLRCDKGLLTGLSVDLYGPASSDAGLFAEGSAEYGNTGLGKTIPSRIRLLLNYPGAPPPGPYETVESEVVSVAALPADASLDTEIAKRSQGLQEVP
ncbi:MAG: hypothetical protein N2111_11095 [Candidatus Sumerlaeaceae bacterium]|nr:hypothetical protein [Candidatus Sumerlaeaceae bacterium]